MAAVALTGAVAVGQAQTAASLTKINPLEALLLPASLQSAGPLNPHAPATDLGSAAGAICGPW